MQRLLPQVKLSYTNSSHAYMINGRKASGVTSLAKIPDDTYAVEAWDRRMILIGAALDRNIIENVAMDLEDRDAINEYVKEAKRIARAHVKADRGSQKHRVLELVLTERENLLLTPQQKQDADVLKRTLDLYKLTPHDGLVEQFVCYPEYNVAGRFDCIMERSDNSLAGVDLKSGINAVLYPRSTSVQLALYFNAPMCSDKVDVRGKDKVSIDNWRELPERLDRSRAYVLLVEQDAKVGSFHEINIEHGWAGAQHALEIVKWRKQFNYGKLLAKEVRPDDPVITDVSVEMGFADMAARAGSVKEAQILWKNAKDQGALTDEVRRALIARVEVLKAAG